MKKYIFLVFLFCVLAVFAQQPTPHGIAGFIYLNTSTQVPSQTPFMINNTATSTLFSDFSGIGPFSGRYSIEIEGSDGNLIVVTAWNKTHFGQTNVSLLGDLDLIDVYLNKTRPPELNITIVFPSNDSRTIIRDRRNLTLNITLIGGQNSTSCYVNLTLNGNRFVYFADGFSHNLQGLSVRQSIFSIWNFTGNGSGTINVSFIGLCQNSGWQFEPSNFGNVINLSVYDPYSPIVYLEGPANNTRNQNTTIIAFSFNASDDDLIANCSLQINGTVFGYVYNVSINTSTNISASIPSDDSLWNITCSDISGNNGSSESRNISIGFLPLNLSNATSVDTLYLNALSHSTLFCNATITGASSVNATFFNSELSSAFSKDDNTTHYSNTSCLSNGNFYSCGFPIQYYARNGSWICNVTAINAIGNQTSNISVVRIPALLGLQIDPDVVDFGNIPSGNTSSSVQVNITNAGNVPLNLALYGYASFPGDNLSMNCSAYVLPANLTRFSLNSSAFDDMQNISSLFDFPTFVNLSLNSRNQSPMLNSTNWRFRANFGEAANCSGSIVFGAVFS